MVADKLKRQCMGSLLVSDESNCIRQPNRQLPSSSYNHDIPQNICEGVITNALQSCSKAFRNSLNSLNYSLSL